MRTASALPGCYARLVAGAVLIALAAAHGKANAEPGIEPAVAVVAASTTTTTESSATTSTKLLRRARERAADMVFAAMNFVGVRYRRGGDSAESGFDCSGFTRQVYEMSLGLVLPRRADEQAAAAGLVAVPRSELKPGDLVFFNTMKRTFSHVGIYIGDNRFIHAPRTGQDIRTDSLDLAYWARRFTGGRRAEAAMESASRQ